MNLSQQMISHVLIYQHYPGCRMNDARFQLISLQTDNFIMRTGYTIQLLVKHLDCGKITITPIYCIDYYEDDEAWL